VNVRFSVEISGLFEHDNSMGGLVSMAEDTVANDLIAKLKKRDEQDSATFQKAQHDQKLIQQAGESTFQALSEILKTSVEQTNAAMGRSVVTFENTTVADARSMRLTGPGRYHIADLKLINNTGHLRLEITGTNREKKIGSLNHEWVVTILCIFITGK
jgi:hypothetical protein